MIIQEIALIMPNRDRQNILNITLESLYKSKLAEKVFIIMIDDNNKYNLENIINKYTHKYFVINNDYRMGADESKGRGIEFAMEVGYKYIIILDDDLIFDENWLIASMDLFESIHEKEKNKAILTVFTNGDFTHNPISIISNRNYFKAHKINKKEFPVSAGNMMPTELANYYFNERKRNLTKEYQYFVEHEYIKDIRKGKLHYYVKDYPMLIWHLGVKSIVGKYCKDAVADWGYSDYVRDNNFATENLNNQFDNIIISCENKHNLGID